MEREKKRGVVVDSNEEEIEATNTGSFPIQKQETKNSIKENRESIASKTALEQEQREDTKKRKTGKGKKSQEAQEAAYEKYASDVIFWMRGLYKKDLEVQRGMGVPNNKLENIDALTTKLVRKDVQEHLKRMGVVNELKVWLEPLPDHSLPNQKIKRAILEILRNMKINKSDLLNSGIGKIVHFYSKNAKEAAEIRKKAGTLMKRWKAMLIQEETLDY